MSGFIFACIAPHGSMIIPLLGKKGAEKALKGCNSLLNGPYSPEDFGIITHKSIPIHWQFGRKSADALLETFVAIAPSISSHLQAGVALLYCCYVQLRNCNIDHAQGRRLSRTQS